MVAFLFLNQNRLVPYHKNTFFKHTYCEFRQIEDVILPEKTHFKSKHNSLYHFTKEGVYRKSNHWGRVATCRWKLIPNATYKNQQTVLGFAKWEDFYPLNETEKIFYILVNFETKKATIKAKQAEETAFLFTLSGAQNKEKQIKKLFKEEKWALYFNQSIEELRIKIISELINSDLTLQQVKLNMKKA